MTTGNSLKSDSERMADIAQRVRAATLPMTLRGANVANALNAGQLDLLEMQRLKDSAISLMNALDALDTLCKEYRERCG